MITEFLIIGLSILLLALIKKDGRPKRFPKGPSGIPILGYLPWLVPKVHIELCKLGKKYGNIFSVKLGGEYFVVLNDFESIKKAMKMDTFAGRPHHMIAIDAFKHGIAYSQGPAWVEQRRFGLRTLRDFGFGKKGMDAVIHENVDELVEHYRKTSGTPQRIQQHVSMTALNLVWQMVTGAKVKLGDPKPMRVFQYGREGIMDKAMNGPIYVMPWLARLIPGMTGLTSLYQARDELHAMFMDIYNNHLKRFQPGQEPMDYVDVFLQKMHELKDDPNSSFYREQGIASFKDALATLFMASSDTLTSTTEFAILYLLKWPEKMRKLREEVDKVLGKRSAVTKDKSRMPYTEAVMQESLRLASILPGLILHSITENVEFEGYFLPKGTTVYPNIFQVHRDPEYWKNPNEFIPERFLQTGPDGNLICRKEERVISFGIGKRECIAVTIAQTEFFIILTSLVQNFDITPVGMLPGIETKTSFVLAPEEYRVVFTPRN